MTAKYCFDCYVKNKEIRDFKADVERLKVLLHSIGVYGVAAEMKISAWYGENSAGQSMPGEIKEALDNLTLKITEINKPENRKSDG